MATAALRSGCCEYQPVHYMIRSKLFKGLKTGSMQVSSLFKDEREKLELPEACAYCGATSELSIDHLIARSKGGSDCGDNFVYCCRWCNSSKGSMDVIQWHLKNNLFPPLNVLRRYLKLAIRYSVDNNLMDLEFISLASFPFVIPAFEDFQSLSELRLVAPFQGDSVDFIK